MGWWNPFASIRDKFRGGSEKKKKGEDEGAKKFYGIDNDGEEPDDTLKDATEGEETTVVEGDLDDEKETWQEEDEEEKALETPDEPTQIEITPTKMMIQYMEKVCQENDIKNIEKVVAKKVNTDELILEVCKQIKENEIAPEAYYNEILIGFRNKIQAIKDRIATIESQKGTIPNNLQKHVDRFIEVDKKRKGNIENSLKEYKDRVEKEITSAQVEARAGAQQRAQAIAQEEARANAQKQQPSQKQSTQKRQPKKEPTEKFRGTTTIEVLYKKINEVDKGKNKQEQVLVAVLKSAYGKYSSDLDDTIKFAEKRASANTTIGGAFGKIAKFRANPQPNTDDTGTGGKSNSEPATTTLGVLKEMVSQKGNNQFLTEALEEYKTTRQGNIINTIQDAQKKAQSGGKTTLDVLKENLESISKKIEKDKESSSYTNEKQKHLLTDAIEEYQSKINETIEEIEKDLKKRREEQYADEAKEKIAYYQESVKGEQNSTELVKTYTKNAQDEARANAQHYTSDPAVIKEQFEYRINHEKDSSSKIILSEAYLKWYMENVFPKAKGDDIGETFKKIIASEKDKNAHQLLSDAFKRWQKEEEEAILEKAKNDKTDKISVTQLLEAQSKNEPNAKKKERIEAVLKEHREKMHAKLEEIEKNAQETHEGLSLPFATEKLFKKKFKEVPKGSEAEYILQEAYQEYINIQEEKKKQTQEDESLNFDIISKLDNIKKLDEKIKSLEAEKANAGESYKSVFDAQIKKYTEERDKLIQAELDKRLEAKMEREKREKEDEEKWKEIQKAEEKEEEERKLTAPAEGPELIRAEKGGTGNNEDAEKDGSKVVPYTYEDRIFKKNTNISNMKIDNDDDDDDDDVTSEEEKEKHEDKRKKNRENSLKFFMSFQSFKKQDSDTEGAGIAANVLKVVDDWSRGVTSETVKKVLSDLKTSVSRANNSNFAKNIERFEPTKNDHAPTIPYVTSMAAYINDLYVIFVGAKATLEKHKRKQLEAGEKDERDTYIGHINEFIESLHKDDVQEHVKNALISSGLFEEEERSSLGRKTSDKTKKLDLRTKHLILGRTAMNLFAAISFYDGGNKGAEARTLYTNLQQIVSNIARSTSDNFTKSTNFKFTNFWREEVKDEFLETSVGKYKNVDQVDTLLETLAELKESLSDKKGIDPTIDVLKQAEKLNNLPGKLGDRYRSKQLMNNIDKDSGYQGVPTVNTESKASQPQKATKK